ncbi:cupin domain-containing protein [Microbacterium fluvii]|uniref:Cupin domain-containing protein n=1 Tax=Microbacterium fluvii TaxID=415215 RepID=A0ABW2HFA2_9MICO|nr:cupin domain-containing protein [Microbacterium fluvii]MCU4672755.1 cupin domain-containing protein [Microbacterium fluvii]
MGDHHGAQQKVDPTERPLVQRRGGEHYDWALYGGAGQVQIEWYFRASSRLGPNVMLYHLEPGASEGEHFHLEGDEGSCSEQSSDELYLVTSGEVVVTLGDERHVLAAGDAVYAPAGLPHGVANETEAPAELVLLFGPPQDSQP